VGFRTQNNRALRRSRAKSGPGYRFFPLSAPWVGTGGDDDRVDLGPAKEFAEVRSEPNSRKFRALFFFVPPPGVNLRATPQGLRKTGLVYDMISGALRPASFLGSVLILYCVVFFCLNLIEQR